MGIHKACLSLHLYIYIFVSLSLSFIHIYSSDCSIYIRQYGKILANIYCPARIRHQIAQRYIAVVIARKGRVLCWAAVNIAF